LVLLLPPDSGDLGRRGWRLFARGLAVFFLFGQFSCCSPPPLFVLWPRPFSRPIFCQPAGLCSWTPFWPSVACPVFWRVLFILRDDFLRFSPTQAAVLFTFFPHGCRWKEGCSFFGFFPLAYSRSLAGRWWFSFGKSTPLPPLLFTNTPPFVVFLLSLFNAEFFPWPPCLSGQVDAVKGSSTQKPSPLFSSSAPVVAPVFLVDPCSRARVSLDPSPPPEPFPVRKCFPDPFLRRSSEHFPHSPFFQESVFHMAFPPPPKPAAVAPEPFFSEPLPPFLRSRRRAPFSDFSAGPSVALPPTPPPSYESLTTSPFRCPVPPETFSLRIPASSRSPSCPRG